MSGKGLVDRVVYNFLDQVVKAALAYVADVHGRTFADGFESFEDLNTILGISGLLYGF
jgi:hypothetical protein